jgi:drug/metabolite transporter (DMT)-like permease
MNKLGNPKKSCKAHIPSSCKAIPNLLSKRLQFPVTVLAPQTPLAWKEIITKMRSALGGLVWLCLAPLFYSAMNSSAKLAGAHLSVWQIGMGRFVLGLMLVPFLIRLLGLCLWGRQRSLLTVRGLCGATAFLLQIAAFQRIPLSVAMVLFYLYPAFTALLSPWLTGEPASKRAWPFIIGAFAGTTLILWPAESARADMDLGHLFAVTAAILCAVTLLLVRRLGKENNIYTLFYYLCLAGTLTSLGPLLLQEGPLLPVGSHAWFELAAIALFSVGAQLSINQALIHIPAPKVSVMMTAEVPLVSCFGVLYLGEPLDWRLLIGSLLIFGCGVGLNILPAKTDFLTRVLTHLYLPKTRRSIT